MAYLVVTRGGSVLRVENLEEQPDRPFDVGRSETCRLQLLDEKASRVHALFFRRDDGRWAVRDQGSRNGVFIGEGRITEAPLSDGDVVRIGGFNLKFSDKAPEVGDFSGKAAGFSDEQPDSAEIASFKTVLWDDARPGESLSGTAGRPRTRKALGALAALAGALRQFSPDTAVSPRAAARKLLAEIAPILRDAVDADRLTPVLVNASGRFMPLAPALRSGLDAGDAPPMSSTIARHACRSRAAVMTRPAHDERFQAARSISALGIGAAMAAPAVSGEKVLALLYCDRLGLAAEAFADADLDMLQVAAALLAAPLREARHTAAMAAEVRRLEKQVGGTMEMSGESPAMKAVFDFIAKAAPTNAGVLISGESGTGKELAARAIHAGSARASAPMETVNCAAMTETLIESELFGHVKGAFTGATADRTGRFEAADGGSLFLDEIGELPVQLQTKLLRVLEYGEFSRVGETAVRRVDVRIIAATNRDLEKAVEDGGFRRDLFYRLNILHLRLPPLRERGGDIRLLAEAFLSDAGERTGRPRLRFSREALGLLQSYGWRGNVRELKNLTERLAVLAPDEVVKPEDLPPEFSGADGVKGDVSFSGGDAAATLAELEKSHILRVLNSTGDNKKKTAEILGIDRSTLYAKLRQYGKK